MGSRRAGAAGHSKWSLEVESRSVVNFEDMLALPYIQRRNPCSKRFVASVVVVANVGVAVVAAMVVEAVMRPVRSS